MKRYVPKIYQKDIYSINYQKLKDNNIKCLLYDLDNTLISPVSKKITKDLEKLISKLKKQNFRVIIFSNSPKKRVSKIADKLKVEYVAFAMKPFKFKFNSFLNKNKYNKNEVAIIGDQLYTDIIGGNKVGIITILVDTIDEQDILITKINRFREKRLEKKLANHKLLVRGEYYE